MNRMASLELLGTGWTVWRVARRRVGPVTSLLVTAGVLAGMIYLRPRLADAVSGMSADS